MKIWMILTYQAERFSFESDIAIYVLRPVFPSEA
jgi:hypothetical protein